MLFNIVCIHDLYLWTSNSTVFDIYYIIYVYRFLPVLRTSETSVEVKIQHDSSVHSEVCLGPSKCKIPVSAEVGYIVKICQPKTKLFANIVYSHCKHYYSILLQ